MGSLKGYLWSDDTIEKAVKVYRTCGTSGYAEILKQGLRWFSNCFFSNDVAAGIDVLTMKKICQTEHHTSSWFIRLIMSK